MKLIAETAWHHEGDFLFMKKLVSEIATKTNADIIKMHVTLNFDEYMDSKHALYKKLKSMLFHQRSMARVNFNG
jgi:N,N'-diacetyllegionaminate synthase